MILSLITFVSFILATASSSKTLDDIHAVPMMVPPNYEAFFNILFVTAILLSTLFSCTNRCRWLFLFKFFLISAGIRIGIYIICYETGLCWINIVVIVCVRWLYLLITYPHLLALYFWRLLGKILIKCFPKDWQYNFVYNKLVFNDTEKLLKIIFSIIQNWICIIKGIRAK